MNKSGEFSNKQDGLSDQKRFTETLLQNLSGMVYRCANDQPWTMTFVSAGCEALTGYTQEQVIGAGFRWADMTHADDRDAARQVVTSALASGQPFDIQYRIVDKFGCEKWVREQGSGIPSDNGSIEAIEGYIDDITPLRRAAVKLAAIEEYYEEELRQEHERLSVTIATSPMGVVTYRHGGPLLSANQAFCDMLGYSEEELGKKSMLELTHPDDRNDSLVFMEKVQRGESRTYSQRKRYLRKDGSVIDVNVVDAITHDSAGRPNLVIGHVADLRAQIKAQSEIRRQREQLAHADRLNTLGEMATGIAHEINQPLTAISLFAQTGKRLYDAGEYDKLREIFDKLSQHSRRAGAIIERMQDMARRREGAKQVISLNALIEGVVDLAEVDARTSDIVIELDKGAELPDVRVDVVQIQQVVLNILRNGMDAMRFLNCSNGNTILLRTRLRGDGFLEVAVIDTGCGISSEVAERLFESFSTSKSTGLGMGLPISKAIVMEHGGQLTFRNNESCGATFAFTLPAGPDGDSNG